MDELTTLLSGTELFRSLSRERLAQIAPGIPTKDFEVGQHVFTPAYKCEVISLLLEGRVRVYRLETSREVTIGVHEAGELFGEAAFAIREGEGSWAQVVAPSRVAYLNRSTFYRLVCGEPELGIRAIEILSKRLSFYERRIADLSLKKVPARLAGLILELAKVDGVATGDGLYRLSSRYSHEELATMIGAQRVAVSRAMKDLRDVGAVESGHRSIVVKDARTLEMIADEAA